MNNFIPKITLLDCPIHSLTMNETLTVIEHAIVAGDQIRHVVVNAAKLVNMKRDKALRDSVITSDIINADGQSVVWAARFLGKRLPERVAGIDLMERLVALAHEKRFKVFFLGAKEEVVSEVVKLYQFKYSKDLIAGYRHGYFDLSEEKEVAQQVADSKADLLFVAITSPKKEIFLNEYKNLIHTPFIMGVGGSFDVVAGLVARAPLWMQKGGLEWFYRIMQEPRRMWKRYLVTNTIFIWEIFKEKLFMRS